MVTWIVGYHMQYWCYSLEGQYNKSEVVSICVTHYSPYYKIGLQCYVSLIEILY